jgi:single-stranded-DNA-specific exonuclease
VTPTSGAGPAVLEIAPYEFASALRLERELGVSHVVAQVLVRRGLSDPGAARAFLKAADEHPPSACAGMAAAVDLLLSHVERGSRITIHGDYDVDGVCSTAILVRALRRLDATVDWLIPSRADDGYGLSLAAVERVAARGTGLLVTVDCAITSVDEVAAARGLGLDVLVTDHHSPRADGRLPDAPIVHPVLGGYPCPDLCAAGVALKIAQALDEATTADGAWREDLDLAALATVADCVPLHGENRRIVRTGIAALADTAKPGLRELMRVARIDPSSLDARGIGFGLAPRINAAGRMQRADAGVELVLTEDGARATEIARELDGLNLDRRDAETRIVFEAQAQVATADEEWPGDEGPPAYVLAGEGWHPGVIGIVASRIAERQNRPVVVVALDGEGGTGSGRSIPAFDLLAGLDACVHLLIRHGGHRAAAGLEVARDGLEDFRAAFVAHAEAALSGVDIAPRERVDAIVSGDELDLALAEELRKLEPHGIANPPPTLLLPAARLAEPRPMGEGKHLRFTAEAGGRRSQAVAFGTTRLPVSSDEPADAAFRLELDAWNGVVSPRLVLRCARRSEPGAIELVGEPDDYLDAVRAALTQSPSPPVVAAVDDLDGVRRTDVDRRGHGIAGTIADLVAAGQPVLVACADARRRRAALTGRLGGFALVAHGALERQPELADPYLHVVALDPPASPAQGRSMRRGSGFTHLAWGAAELRFAQQIHEQEFVLRDQLAALYRALRARGSAGGEELEATLRGEGPAKRSPALAGRLLRILEELGLVSLEPGLSAVAVTSTERTTLERSPTFAASTRRLEEQREYLDLTTRRAA